MADSPHTCPPHCHPALTELRLYQAFIFSTPILFSLVLLLLFYMLYLRRRRTTWAASQIRAQILARGLISTPFELGLNKSFREMLPTMVFNESVAAIIEDTQCTVCLGDYQMNEKLLHLPVCGHAFHFDCIDKWLSNNTTCPICRTSLLQATKIIPLDLGAQTVTLQQTHESTEVLPEGSVPQQAHHMEGLPTQECCMSSLTVEEHISMRNGGTCELPSINGANAHEVDSNAKSLPAESSSVKSDFVICIEPNGTGL